MKMENRVYGAILVKVTNGNYNADFTGHPKSCNELLLASSATAKYSMRQLWSKDKPVFSIKTYSKDLKPFNINEKYENMFNEKIKSSDDNDNDNDVSQEETSKSKSKSKPTDDKKNFRVFKNLITCVDVLNFGVTFAGNANLGITGPVQITEAISLTDDFEIVSGQIMSPFSNSNKSDASQSTLGFKAMVDNVYMCHGFSLNPSTLREFEIDSEEFTFEGYPMEAYEAFKEAAITATTNLNTSTKVGCENFASIFVECNNPNVIMTSNLQHYIKIEDNEDSDFKIINLSNLSKYLKRFKSSIDKIEIYFNTDFNEIILGEAEGLNYKFFNILDKEEIDINKKL